MSYSLPGQVPAKTRAGSGVACRFRDSNNSLASSQTHASRAASGAVQAQVGAIPSKLRCFYWCCCCTCDCLTPGRKAPGENGPRRTGNNAENSSHSQCEVEVSPSLDEVAEWGRSFDKLMKSEAGRKVFAAFLQGEYSEENMLFWLACEEFKLQNVQGELEERARIIYAEYISVLSSKEVSLDSKVREIVNQKMVEPTPHTFDEAQLQIYTLMQRDSYPRFINSTLFKALCEQAPKLSQKRTSPETHG